ERVAERVLRHRRALDVPSRAPCAPRRRPRGLAGLLRLPQREVERELLALTRLEPRATPQLLDVAVGERPVVLLCADAVVDVARRSRVGVAVLDDPLDHPLDDAALEVVSDPRPHIGTEEAEETLLFLPLGNVLVRQLERVLAELMAAV